MHFDLDEEQTAIRNTLDSLLTDRLPNANIVARLEDETFNRHLWKELAEMGLMSILAPEGAADGLGMGLLTLGVVAERLAFHAAPAPVVENALAAWLLASARPDLAGALMRGEKIAGLALAEGPSATPDAWTLAPGGATGTKSAVVWGGEADVLIAGLEGGRIGVIDAGARGVTVTPVSTVDLSRVLATVAFDNAAIEVLDTGEATADRLMDALYVLAAMDAYGAAERCAQLAVDYVKVREQFGRPIGSFQGLKHQLADMTALLRPSQFLGWIAAHQWDNGADDAPRLASVAKAHLTDVAIRTGRISVEAHGGIGYTWEYPLQVFLKRAMHDRAIYGAPAFHRERAARLGGWTG